MTQVSQKEEVLVKLSDSALTLTDPTQDLRGRRVVDQRGDEIGHVSGLFVDKNEKKVRLLQVVAGGFLGLGERHFMIPVEAISSTSDAKVQINHTLKHVINSPAYDPTLANQVRGTGLWQPYYDYYGYAPYWGGSVGYPL